MKKKYDLRPLLYAACMLLLLAVMLFSGIMLLESAGLGGNEEPDDGYVSKTVIRDGVAYYPRQDITVFLVLGIDRFGAVEDSGFYTNPGDADMVSLVIFDEGEKTMRVLALNRDTMVKMPVLGLGGQVAGSRYAQLALSHTYGGGLHDSCENVRQTVLDLLGGIEIDYYLSMNMDAIVLLNDAVGGVEVEVEEDFSAVDPSIPMGRVRLLGQQAVNYIRTRKDVGDQLNISRMARHEKYMAGFRDALWAKIDADSGFVYDVYESISDYIVTDCSVKGLSALLERYRGYDLVEVVSPAGENVRGEEYMEFYVEAEALEDLVLRLFYAPKEPLTS